MQLTAVVMLAACLQVSASSYAQKVSISGRNISLKKVFKDIREQTGYNFIYANEDLENADHISLHVKDAPLLEVLNACFVNQPLSFKINDKIIIVKRKEDLSSTTAIILRDVSGKVIDASTGSPLPGVTIRVKGSTIGTVTDAHGAFNLSVPDNSVIEISFIGYQSEAVQVAGQTSLEIKLKVANTALNQLVVIGYGQAVRKDITGAISSVKVNELSADASGNVSSALQGRVAGVNVESSGGAPGAGLSITIRGSSTLGNNTPLYVVDGMFVSNLDFVNPSDIASIEVLKDAAAASIYGSRAANGVVIITTKSGKIDSKPKIHLSAMYGFQDIPRRIGVLSGEQWTNVFQTYATGTPAYNGINTNWQNAIFRTAPIWKVNANISGGSENFIYDLSAGYLNQLGTIKETNYSSVNFRIKTQFEKGRFKLGETVMLQKSGGRQLPGGGDQSGSVITSSLIMPSIVPVRDTANQLGGWGRRPSFVKNLSNPLADLTAYDNTINTFNVVADAYMEIRIVDQLKYKLNVGLSDGRSLSNNFTNPYDDGNNAVVLPNLTQASSLGTTWLVENTLSYDKSFGRHHIDLLAGYTAQKDSSEGFNAYGSNIPVGVYTMNGATANLSAGGSASSVRRVSLLGRLSYNYASKYLFMASIRRDGSSIFAQGYQYGVFPSLSAGWNVSNEEFFQNSKLATWVNNLKIRGSWGVLGNDLINPYTTQSTISSYLNYIQGTQSWQGAIPNGNASPTDLKWEQTKTVDGGLDASFLNNKLTLTFDVYRRTTSGVLLAVPVPISLGITGSPVVNAGVVENKGIELSLDYSKQTGSFKYDIGGNISTLKNEMTAITIGSGSQEFGDITQARVGYPLGGFWLIKTDGIFQSDAQAAGYVNKSGQPIQPNAKGGDIKFVDYNNDGQINNDDRQFVGTPFPKVLAGLSGYFEWKNFDLNILFQGVFGNKIYDRTAVWIDKMTEITNLSTDVLQAWTPQHPTNFPRFILTDPNQNAQLYSDRWLEDGSYVRLKRLELGYTILKDWAQRMKIDQIRVNVATENLFILTKYKGYNPDMGNGGNPLSRGIDNGQYPIQRTISFGVNVTF